MIRIGVANLLNFKRFFADRFRFKNAVFRFDSFTFGAVGRSSRKNQRLPDDRGGRAAPMALSI